MVDDIRPSDNRTCPKTLPDFILIGAARSGTTWIAKNLEQHPEIFIPRKKELHFFDSPTPVGLEFYESYFREVGSASAIGEATPAYLHVEPAAARIKETLPDVKLLVCLRNPVDRLYSRYWNARGRFLENTGLSFEEKLEQKPSFIAEGFYVDHLRRYLELFPREQLLILLFDDLKDDPASFMASMYRFIGVSDDYYSELLRQQINAAADQKLVVRSRSMFWLGKVLRRFRWHKIARQLELRNSAKLPSMSSDTRRWLIDVYRDKNRQLGELIDRDLSHWNST